MECRTYEMGSYSSREQLDPPAPRKAGGSSYLTRPCLAAPTLTDGGYPHLTGPLPAQAPPIHDGTPTPPTRRGYQTNTPPCNAQAPTTRQAPVTHPTPNTPTTPLPPHHCHHSTHQPPAQHTQHPTTVQAADAHQHNTQSITTNSQQSYIEPAIRLSQRY